MPGQNRTQEAGKAYGQIVASNRNGEETLVTLRFNELPALEQTVVLLTWPSVFVEKDEDAEVMGDTWSALPEISLEDAEHLLEVFLENTSGPPDMAALATLDVLQVWAGK